MFESKFLFGREEIHFFPASESLSAKATVTNIEINLPAKEEAKVFAEDDFEF